jgi:hypothetical protein
MLSGALEIRHGLSATASTGEYALPDPISRIFRVAYDEFPLAPTSQRELDDLDQYHRTREGDPEMWTKDRTDERRIRFYPIPTTTGPGSTFGEEPGIVYDVSNDDDTFTFNNEVGEIVEATCDGMAYALTSEFGVVVDFDVSSQDFEVWAKKLAHSLLSDDDTPEIPGYAHLGLAFAAAARVLTNRTEIRNDTLAAVYESQAQDYARHLTRITNNRTPEKVERQHEPSHLRDYMTRYVPEIPEP